MTYSALKLVTNSYYASGIRAREFNTPSPSDISDGLEVLNDCLQTNTVDFGMLPYYTKYDFNFETGVSDYEIENLIDVRTIVFFLNSVRFSMRSTPIDVYHGNTRAEQVSSLPQQWVVDRDFGGATLRIYPKPSQDLPAQLWGYFRLPEITSLAVDLSLILDRFYINYMKYFLAGRLCEEFNQDVPMGTQKQLAIFHKLISKRSAKLDLTQKITLTNANQSTINWAFANLSNGWTPGAGWM